jgi:hypothetical protein
MTMGSRSRISKAVWGMGWTSGICGDMRVTITPADERTRSWEGASQAIEPTSNRRSADDSQHGTRHGKPLKGGRRMVHKGLYARHGAVGQRPGPGPCLELPCTLPISRPIRLSVETRCRELGAYRSHVFLLSD